jgi:hypothetical protein
MGRDHSSTPRSDPTQAAAAAFRRRDQQPTGPSTVGPGGGWVHAAPRGALQRGGGCSARRSVSVRFCGWPGSLRRPAPSQESSPLFGPRRAVVDVLHCKVREGSKIT